MLLRVSVLLFICLFSLNSFSQTYQDSVMSFQLELNKSYADPVESPLGIDKLMRFEGLPFFPINETFRVKAKLEILPPASPFQLKTSDRQLRDYDRYAIATFSLNGIEYHLTIYQNTASNLDPDEEKSLFLPFTDLSNGKETYGGGRYLDFEIPEGDVLEIDFNKAYNPYCAYSNRYSCPIPPKENDLPVAILAGVMYEK
ncbi:DUF1684 domain-containing protein [Algoriphagus litoralis]|uniref:DUF1684 domain-containing protein n=1 Tax=Algoriphagus litoralis TaxID=2202829 RepID=UPI0018E539B6|nr:DUF1684 domain-containing protein [Algoriphagus litoralis]